MNLRLLFTLLLVLLVCSGCESFRDALMTDGGKVLSDTFLNSLGMMVDASVQRATGDIVTGADLATMAREIKDSYAAGDPTLKVLGGVLGGGTALGIGIKAFNVYTGKLKAMDPKA